MAIKQPFTPKFTNDDIDGGIYIKNIDDHLFGEDEKPKKEEGKEDNEASAVGMCETKESIADLFASFPEIDDVSEEYDEQEEWEKVIKNLD